MMILAIDIDGDWRRYARTIPSGADALGTVTCDDGKTGALIRFRPSGRYVRLIGRSRQLINAKEVNALLRPCGRPLMLSGGRNVSLYLDDDTIDAARRIGNGNVSYGVRIAVAAMASSGDKTIDNDNNP